MRQIAWTAFVAFWAAVVTILVAGALAPETRPKPKQIEPEAEGPRTIGSAELAEHNSEDDCWMAIRGKVYDFTDFISSHPTPPEVMTDWCGTEATHAYDTKGDSEPHSEFADRLLEEYYVGEYSDG